MLQANVMQRPTEKQKSTYDKQQAAQPESRKISTWCV